MCFLETRRRLKIDALFIFPWPEPKAHAQPIANLLKFTRTEKKFIYDNFHAKFVTMLPWKNTGRTFNVPSATFQTGVKMPLLKGILQTSGLLQKGKLASFVFIQWENGWLTDWDRLRGRWRVPGGWTGGIVAAGTGRGVEIVAYI